MCNFYSLYFEKNKYIPVIKNGVKIEVKNNVAYLDGVFSYRLFTKPQEYDVTETSLDKLFFLYPNNRFLYYKLLYNYLHLKAN